MKKLCTIILFFYVSISFSQFVQECKDNPYTIEFQKADTLFKIDWKNFSQQLDSILNANDTILQHKLFDQTNDIINSKEAWGSWFMVNSTQYLQQYWIGYIDGICSKGNRTEQMQYLKDFMTMENQSVIKEINRRKSEYFRDYWKWMAKKELLKPR